MKFLKNRTYYKILSVVTFLAILTSCTDYMDSLNQDEKLITDKDLQQDANEGGFLLPLMMNRIASTTTSRQTQQNLNAESYAGYLESPTDFLGNENTMTYFMVPGWNNNAWNVSTTGIMDQWLQMSKLGYDEKYPDLYAIALILKAMGGHRLVDVFGPYPYSKYGESVVVKFDSEEEAYNAIFADLDAAVVALQAAEAENPDADAVRFAKWDKSSLGGEYTNWIKLANTIRLRLAIRISNVSPAKAQEEAEKAIDPANGGVLTTEVGPFSLPPQNGTNPIYTFANAWSDTRMAAPIITFLKGFGDPRLEAYALPAEDPELGGEIMGIRPGIAKPSKSVYQFFSKPNIEPETPCKQVSSAESYFLMAEGALRGWNMGGGTVQQYYEDGIRASFAEVGAGGVEEYLQSTGTQIPFMDPKNADNNIGPMTDITVKWDEAATFEEKLERIITQKWIALYPEGVEAWSEFRRTGYPKLYPIVVINNPDFSPGEFIKRLTYPPAATNAGQAQVTEAVNAYLGGKDSAATPIWWDVD